MNSKTIDWVKVGSFLSKFKSISGKVIRFFAKTFMVLFIVLFVVGCIAGGYIGFKVMPTLDDYKQIAYDKFDSIGPNTFSHLSDTVIYDKNGEIISEINVGNYQYVGIENVSKWVQEGYIAVEDKRFKVHNGIDYKALARAGFALIKNRGNITQGGSTITQQVLKNNLLTQERTFKRKLIEFFLAPEFESKYSKQDIMEFYVNTNFYGNNCYGIEAASQYYFGKPAKDLTIAESALFVGMSNNASYYNPRTNYDATMQKWRFVVDEMKEEGVITEEEYQEVLNTKLEFVYEREGRRKEDYLTSYAIHCAVLSLLDEENFEYKYLFENELDYTLYREKYVDRYNEIGEKIRAGGYQIYTSLDQEMQSKLQKIVDNNTAGFKEKSEDGRYAFQSAAVIVNNETGYIEAIVGGRGTDDEYNRGFLAKRQPGSSIKPLVVYAPAYNSGLYFPSMIMTDKDDPKDKYYPRNYSGNFLGNMTIKEAVGRSTNTIAYQIMKSIGANTGLEYLANMRFDTISYVDNNNTAVALGGFTYGVRVSDMAKGYSTLVNKGEYIDNNCVIKIDYQNEGTIFEEDSERKEVYDEDAAYMMVDSCKAVMYEPYGTSTSRRPNNAIVMGKTGTTNEHKDAWFCGASSYYSMAVWCGYDTPRSTGLTGGSLPGKIWQQMMVELHKGKEKVEFERPETVITKPVNSKGLMAKNDTGVYGIFSQNLLDKAEEERKANIERKKISADNQLISEIEAELKLLRNYKIVNNSALDYLTASFSDLDKRIANVYQTENIPRLDAELESIKSYFAVDIRTMQQYNERQTKIEKANKGLEQERIVVSSLNDLNSYVVYSRYDISKVEALYRNVERQLKLLKDSGKVEKYTGYYEEIKKYKEISLKPYRLEIEQEKQKQKDDAQIKLLEYMEILNTYTVYSDDLEVLFKNIESHFEYCKSIEVDISGVYEDYLADKEYLLSTKPIEEPEIEEPIEETKKEEEQEDADENEEAIENSDAEEDSSTENETNQGLENNLEV